jgi:DNA-binding transcriptional MocR family regulator
VHQFQREVTNPGLVPLGRAIPPADVIPQRALATMIRAELRTATSEAMQYQVPPGHVLLREQLAKRSITWGCQLRPNDFVTTVGCTEAVHLALSAIAGPGDTIAVESPTFFGTLQMLSHLRLKALEIPADTDSGLALHPLERALRRHRLAAILTVPSYNNPSGSLQSQDQRERLVTLAQRHNVPVIEVDLYGDLHHEGRRPWAAKRYDRTDSVLLCGSFSKTVAPGMRVGWIAPGRYYDRVVAAQLSSTYATPTLPSAALGRFLKEGGYDRFLRQARATYHERVSATRALLQEHLPGHCQISRPQGGYLLWVTLASRADSWSIYLEARRQGLSIAPGELFSNGGAFKHCCRIHGGHPLTPRVKDAFRTLGKIIASCGAKSP